MPSMTSANHEPNDKHFVKDALFGNMGLIPEHVIAYLENVYRRAGVSGTIQTSVDVGPTRHIDNYSDIVLSFDGEKGGKDKFKAVVESDEKNMGRLDGFKSNPLGVSTRFSQTSDDTIRYDDQPHLLALNFDQMNILPDLVQLKEKLTKLFGEEVMDTIVISRIEDFPDAEEIFHQRAEIKTEADTGKPLIAALEKALPDTSKFEGHMQFWPQIDALNTALDDMLAQNVEKQENWVNRQKNRGEAGRDRP